MAPPIVRMGHKTMLQAERSETFWVQEPMRPLATFCGYKSVSYTHLTLPTIYSV